jgi:hypothetical protein
MKNLRVSGSFLLTVFVFAVSSCKKAEITPPSSTKSAESILRVSDNSAQVYRYQQIIDLSVGWNEFNACTGNLVDITSGIWHIDFSYILNGNRFTYVDHSNVSGYKLLDLTTGIEYVGSYISNTSFTGTSTGDFPIQITGTVKILLTTNGGGNNGTLFADYHGTINANGIESVWFDNYRAGCQ